MATKFSDFNSETTLGNITGLVGYISSSNTNVRISPSDLITGTTNTLAQVLAAGSIATNANPILIETASGNNHTLSASGTARMEVKADRDCNIQGAFDDATGSLNLIVGQAGADFTVLLSGSTPSIGDVLQVSAVDVETGTLEWATPSAGGIAIGDTITSATEGSILFAGAAGVLAQDNANFFWDDTNNRLGIGTLAPAQEIHVTGVSDQEIQVESTGGNAILTLLSADANNAFIDFEETGGERWIVGAYNVNDEFCIADGGGFASSRRVSVSRPTAPASAELRLWEGGSSASYVALKAPDSVAASITYTFPGANGAPGQYLKTDGSGNLSWDNPSGGGGLAYNVTTQTTNYTAADGDVVLCDVTGTLRVTLPAAASNAVVGVKYKSQNAVTDVLDVLTPAGVQIDGVVRSATALVLPAVNTYYEFISDGTNWFIK